MFIYGTHFRKLPLGTNRFSEVVTNAIKIGLGRGNIFSDPNNSTGLRLLLTSGFIHDTGFFDKEGNIFPHISKAIYDLIDLTVGSIVDTISKYRGEVVDLETVVPSHVDVTYDPTDSKFYLTFRWKAKFVLQIADLRIVLGTAIGSANASNILPPSCTYINCINTGLEASFGIADLDLFQQKPIFDCSATSIIQKCSQFAPLRQKVLTEGSGKGSAITKLLAKMQHDKKVNNGNTKNGESSSGTPNASTQEDSEIAILERQLEEAKKRLAEKAAGDNISSETNLTEEEILEQQKALTQKAASLVEVEKWMSPEAYHEAFEKLLARKKELEAMSEVLKEQKSSEATRIAEEKTKAQQEKAKRAAEKAAERAAEKAAKKAAKKAAEAEEAKEGGDQ